MALNDALRVGGVMIQVSLDRSHLRNEYMTTKQLLERMGQSDPIRIPAQIAGGQSGQGAAGSSYSPGPSMGFSSAAISASLASITMSLQRGLSISNRIVSGVNRANATLDRIASSTATTATAQRHMEHAGMRLFTHEQRDLRRAQMERGARTLLSGQRHRIEGRPFAPAYQTFYGGIGPEGHRSRVAGGRRQVSGDVDAQSSIDSSATGSLTKAGHDLTRSAHLLGRAALSLSRAGRLGGMPATPVTAAAGMAGVGAAARFAWPGGRPLAPFQMPPAFGPVGPGTHIDPTAHAAAMGARSAHWQSRPGGGAGFQYSPFGGPKQPGVMPPGAARPRPGRSGFAQLGMMGMMGAGGLGMAMGGIPMGLAAMGGVGAVMAAPGLARGFFGEREGGPISGHAPAGGARVRRPDGTIQDIGGGQLIPGGATQMRPSRFQQMGGRAGFGRAGMMGGRAALFGHIGGMLAGGAAGGVAGGAAGGVVGGGAAGGVAGGGAAGGASVGVIGATATAFTALASAAIAAAPPISVVTAAITAFAVAAAPVAPVVIGIGVGMLGLRRSVALVVTPFRALQFAFSTINNVIDLLKERVRELAWAFRHITGAARTASAAMQLGFRAALSPIRLFTNRVDQAIVRYGVLGATARGVGAVFASPFRLALFPIMAIVRSLRMVISTAALLGPILAVGAIGKGIMAAGELEMVMGRVETAFGDVSGRATAFADRMAQDFGFVRAQVLETQAQLGLMFTGVGTGHDPAEQMSRELTERAANMASVFGRPIEDLKDAFQSALAGQFMPLRKYDTLITAAAVKQRAFSMGLAQSTTEVSEQARVMATYSLLMERSSQFQDGLNMNMWTFANVMRMVRGRIINAFTDLGEKLIPAAREFALLVDDMLIGGSGAGRFIGKAFEQLGSTIQRIVRISRQMFQEWDAVVELFLIFAREGGTNLSSLFAWMAQAGANAAMSIGESLVNSIDGALKIVQGLFVNVWNQVGADFLRLVAEQVLMASMAMPDNMVGRQVSPMLEEVAHSFARQSHEARRAADPKAGLDDIREGADQIGKALAKAFRFEIPELDLGIDDDTRSLIDKLIAQITGAVLRGDEVGQRQAHAVGHEFGMEDGDGTGSQTTRAGQFVSAEQLRSMQQGDAFEREQVTLLGEIARNTGLMAGQQAGAGPGATSPDDPRRFAMANPGSSIVLPSMLEAIGLGGGDGDEEEAGPRRRFASGAHRSFNQNIAMQRRMLNQRRMMASRPGAMTRQVSGEVAAADRTEDGKTNDMIKFLQQIAENTDPAKNKDEFSMVPVVS